MKLHNALPIDVDVRNYKNRKWSVCMNFTSLPPAPAHNHRETRTKIREKQNATPFTLSYSYYASRLVPGIHS